MSRRRIKEKESRMKAFYDKLKIQILKNLGCNGILITDGEGIVTYVDTDYFYSVWGLEEGYLLGKSAYMLDEKQVIKPVLAIRVMETKSAVTEISAVRGNYDVVGEAFPVFDGEGKICEVISYTRDIASQKEIHEKYQKLLSGLEMPELKYDVLEEENASIVKEGIYTYNSEFKQIIGKIEKMAPYDITLLFTGDTGCGKTTFAKKVHKISGLKGEFVSLNCGAIPENLFESELYGYEKGAFTGAEKSGRKGLAEVAENGTLLLDEISELPMSQQVKLLDFLEERKIRRVGGHTPIDVNCRVIAATNKNLLKLVSEGKFREDLYFRLNVAAFEIPSLADRKEDIIPLAKNMIRNFNYKYNKQYAFADDVFDAFESYEWPGNLRELDNVIHSMILMSKGEFIEKEVLPYSIAQASCEDSRIKDFRFKDKENTEEYKDIIERFERELFSSYYKKYGSSVKVARVLNISQTTAARKIRKYTQK